MFGDIIAIITAVAFVITMTIVGADMLKGNDDWNK